MRMESRFLKKIYIAIGALFIISLLLDIDWARENNLEMESGTGYFNTVLDSLGNNGDSHWPIMDRIRIVCLEKLAQTLYEENPIGVENVKFKYYLLDIKNTDQGISDEEFGHAVRILVETEKYIQNYDVEIMEYVGTDYRDDRYDPERLGKSIEELKEQEYEYDYALLEDYEKMFTNIDRKRGLAGIFNKICGQEESNLERHKAVLQYCNKISAHSTYVLPLNAEGEMVVDPIILMELHEMQCGQVARIACDLFSAVGYQTRLVQLGGHVIAEIYYDGEWHYFDADIWNGNEVVEEPGGGYSVSRGVIL